MSSNRKKRILWLGEASFINTGYSTYQVEILNRLFNTNKYEIAELGCYGEANDPKRWNIPWRYYANLPNLSNRDEINIYNSDPTNEFGRWRFEDVCIDFRPDIVCDVRDIWMCNFAEYSPFRDFFHWFLMPTIDSHPQEEQNIKTYINADAIFTYSKYGKDVLINESNGKVNFKGSPSPAANPEVFKPVPNKSEHRRKYGFQDDVKIIGTVMRNQGRKLFPDLFEAFSQGNFKNTYLYCHTAYPDNGWDIPRWLRYFNISHKVLFTYLCSACGYVFPNFFQDSVMVCPRCTSLAAKLPTTRNGISSRDLADIYNFFDLYVQYSNCEGFGMPLIEASYCGVPIAAVDYSAMSSIINDVGGIKIPVQRYFYDSAIQTKRALPDNTKFIDLINHFFKKPKMVQQKCGMDNMFKAKEFYNYDKSTKIWEECIDNVKIRDWKDTWESKARIHTPDLKCPPGLTNAQFVNWAMINVLGDPSQVNSHMALRMLRDLNCGEGVVGMGGSYFNENTMLSNREKYFRFNREIAVNQLLHIVEKRNYFEKRRTGLIKEEMPEYIRMVKPSE